MIIPFDARVVVKKPKRQEQTASGIILPDSAEDGKQTDKGEVVAVGPGSRYVGGDRIGTGERMEIPVKVGQTILYSKFQLINGFCYIFFELFLNKKFNLFEVYRSLQ